MQIVIDISEDIKAVIDKNGTNEIVTETVWQAVKKGTPLPKGHGRLIDADELKKHKYHDNNRFENAVAIAQIDWAETTIEADKEVQDDDRQSN